MGRTATAFLVLIAVGGCVADDQGPAAAAAGGPAGPAGCRRCAGLRHLEQDGPVRRPPGQRADDGAVATLAGPGSDDPDYRPETDGGAQAHRRPGPYGQARAGRGDGGPRSVQATLVQTPGISEPTNRETVAPAKAAGPSAETKMASPSSDAKLKDLGADAKLKDLGADAKLKDLGADAKLKDSAPTPNSTT